MTEYETLLARLHSMADIWDELASMQNAPHAFGDVYRICASELRAELRVANTIPAPPPSAE